MRRALDWLVVDAGGRSAGVVPFASAGVRQTDRDRQSFPEVYARVLHALQEQAGAQARGDEDSATAEGDH